MGEDPGVGLSVRLLGPLELAGPTGTVRLSGARQRAVFALLALRSPGVVSQADLVDGLWGTDPPPTAVKTLHSHIARIRHALAGIGHGDLLVTREPGYALALSPGRVDVTAFEVYLAAGRKAAQEGDPATAAVQLRAGLALWRGDPLADCPVAEWGAAEVARLNEAMVGAAEALAEADVMRGEHTAVASELERLVARHPLRERLWELLVVAHHRSGHPAEALQAYRRARAVLIDELGVEPGPRLRRLEGELLAGVAELDPAIAPVARRETPAVASRVALARLVGRRFELAEVLELVRGKRLVTLTGPGGCGKTRLATAATERLAAEFRTELVDLTAVRSPEGVTEAVATALNIPEQPGKDRHDALVAGLAGQELLVVLDNCEQVVAAVSLLVESLLTRCPELRVLATSREALRIPGEAAYAVPPLAVPDPEIPRTLAELATYDAVRLFLDRAAEHAGPDFTDDDSRPIATLCAALDGLPLAIELAAARTPVLTPAQIVVRLRDRFGLLSYGTRTSSPPHHRALRAALAWSHDLLSADEAALFARLAVFVGGFGVEAAEAVWHPERTLDALTGLVAKSLVRSGRTGGSTRFWMLETISAYAKEKLTADPVLEAATRRQHATFFLEWIEQAARDASGAEFGELRVEHENLRAAMSWHTEAENGRSSTDELRMAAALSRYCRLYGHYHDGRRWLAEALRRSAEAPADLRARALTGAASLALSECDYDQADRHAAEALELVDQGQVGRLRLLRGAVARERARYTEALEHYGASEHAFHAFGDRAGAAYSRQLAGATSWQAGDLDAAKGALTASLAALRELDDRRGEASSRAYLGAVALYRGDRATARQLLDQSLDTFGELDFKEGIAWALNLLGLVEHRDDNHAEATRLLEASLALHRDLGDLWRQASVLEALACVSCATLDVARAVQLLRQATEIRTLIGAPVPTIERPALAAIHATLTPHTQFV